MQQHEGSKSGTNSQLIRATLHEQRTAENSAAYLLPKLYSLREANPHLSLLDVGSGTGTISMSLAKLIPDGHVTGIDVNTQALSRARAIVQEHGISNIEFREGSVFELPFDDESFDIVCCHQVLIHIGNPWDALREMLRVTKRAGIVAVREGDYATEAVWPELPGLVKFHQLLAGLMSAGGGTPTAGRQLVNWAIKAGARREHITLTFSTSSYCTPGERKVCAQGLCSQLRAGGMREKAIKFNLAGEREFEEMARSWEEWQDSEDASLAMLHGEIIVQK